MAAKASRRAGAGDRLGGLLGDIFRIGSMQEVESKLVDSSRKARECGCWIEEKLRKRDQVGEEA